MGYSRIVATQYSRSTCRWLRCSTRRRSTSSSGGRGGGGTRGAREDLVRREADVVRRRGKAQGHQGGQELAGLEFGGIEEIRGERPQGHEGLCTKGRSREDHRHLEGAGRRGPDGVTDWVQHHEMIRAMAQATWAYLQVIQPYGLDYALACTNARVTIYRSRPRQIRKIRHGSVYLAAFPARPNGQLSIAVAIQKAGY